MADIIFYFDPACPWTWKTSRWLEVVAAEKNFDVEWRACSLAVINGDDTPAQYRDRVDVSAKALRLVESLRLAGRNADVGRFYAELGKAVFGTNEMGGELSQRHVLEAVTACGLDAEAAALDDDTLDAVVADSTDEAMRAAGPGVGSPVIKLPAADRGFHGPIIAKVPSTPDSVALFEATCTMMQLPEFYEIKRGR